MSGRRGSEEARRALEAREQEEPPTHRKNRGVPEIRAGGSPAALAAPTEGLGVGVDVTVPPPPARLLPPPLAPSGTRQAPCH